MDRPLQARTGEGVEGARQRHEAEVAGRPWRPDEALRQARELEPPALSGDDQQADAKRDRPAALAFDGDVYKGLDARTLEARELRWSQDHVAILSGLYGVLRPLDLIEPYRLEMGTRLETKRGESLYDYWGDIVTEHLAKRLADTGSEVVVNLASNEYSRSVQFKKLEVPVITPVFQEISDGKHKVISFFAKRARGAMARYIIDKRRTNVEDLKRFNEGGYKYDEALSSQQTWVFARPKPPPAK